MKHPQSSRTLACPEPVEGFRFANPLEGAHATAGQSPFRACSRMACSAAFGSAACLASFHAVRVTRSAVEN